MSVTMAKMSGASEIAKMLRLAASFAADEEKAVISSVRLEHLPGLGIHDHGIVAVATDGITLAYLRDANPECVQMDPILIKSYAIKKLLKDDNKMRYTSIEYNDDAAGVILSVDKLNARMLVKSSEKMFLAVDKTSTYPNYHAIMEQRLNRDEYYYSVDARDFVDGINALADNRDGHKMDFNDGFLSIYRDYGGCRVFARMTGTHHNIDKHPDFTGIVTVNIQYLKRVAAVIRERGNASVHIKMTGPLKPIHIYHGQDVYLVMPINRA